MILIKFCTETLLDGNRARIDFSYVKGARRPESTEGAIVVTDEISGGPAGSSEVAALLHELTEALTALGNYVAAAHRQVADPSAPIREELEETLGKSLVQYERAATAMQLLAALHRRDGENESAAAAGRNIARNDA